MIVPDTRPPISVLGMPTRPPHPFDLVVGNAAVMLVVPPKLIFSMIVTDGKANWFKAVRPLSVYVLRIWP